MRIENLIATGANVSVTVNAVDLKEAFMEFQEELYNKMCAEKEKVETYLTQKQTMEMLGCSQPTLWRWNKAGYLRPIKIGAKARYRMSDITKIMEGQIMNNQKQNYYD